MLDQYRNCLPIVRTFLGKAEKHFKFEFVLQKASKMGPKKKGVKKKVGKKSSGTKGPTVIDGVPVSEMTKDQLEGHVRRLQEEVMRPK